MDPVLFFSVAAACKDCSFLLKGFLECIIPIILLLYKLKNAWHSTVFRDRDFTAYESCIIFQKPGATLEAKLNCSLKTMFIVLNELTLSSQIVTHSRNHKSNTALYQTRGKASVLPFGRASQMGSMQEETSLNKSWCIFFFFFLWAESKKNCCKGTEFLDDKLPATILAFIPSQMERLSLATSPRFNLLMTWSSDILHLTH